MSHHLRYGAYSKFINRLNQFPQGAPPSDLLYRILSLLFTPEEAVLAAQLPLRPFTAAKAARIWKKPEAEAMKILDRLADRGVLLDVERNGVLYYVLPPPMAGFFEFSLMRRRPGLDQQSLSRLFHQYINEEDAFIRELFAGGETQLGRVLVMEPSLPKHVAAAAVLGFERSTEIIGTASHIAVGTCYCRQKMVHVGKACDAPLDNCLTLNDAAASLIRRGTARRIEAVEGLDLLQQAWSCGLIQCADNVRQGVNFICNCCKCCCEGLIAVRRLALTHPLFTTNFIPVVTDRCTGCRACIPACPIEALAIAEIPSPGQGGRPAAVVNLETCLGCGLCVRSCSRGAIKLLPRHRRVVTPVNTAHRIVLMAIERNKLPQLIFDNQALFSHRLMAAILGVIMRLPVVKQAMASRQLKSRYLERLLSRCDIV